MSTRAWQRRHHSQACADELDAIIVDAPRFEGALCRGHAPEWDADDFDTVDRAAWLCAHACPALHACRDWLHSTPADRRPAGVVAGQVVAPSGAIRKAC